MKDKLSIGLTLVGLFLLVVSSANRIEAATSYFEEWQATSYRTVRATRDNWPNTPSTGAYCLGPASWDVTGSVGTTNFSETWTVPVTRSSNGWLDTQARSNDQIYTVSYDFSNDCVDDDSRDSLIGDFQITTIGLYGGMISIGDGGSASNRINGDGLDSWNFDQDIQGVRSMPVHWHVEGSTQ